MKKSIIPVIILAMISFACVALIILGCTPLEQNTTKQLVVDEFHLSDYQEKILLYPWDTNIGIIDSSEIAALKAEVLWAVEYGETANPGKETEVFFDSAEKCWLIKGSFSKEIPPDMPIAHLIPFMLAYEDGRVIAVWFDYEVSNTAKGPIIYDDQYGPDFAEMIPSSVTFVGNFNVADYEQQMENGRKVFRPTVPIEDFQTAAEVAQKVWNETEPSIGSGWLGSWENPGKQVEVYYDKDNSYWLVKGTVPYEAKFTHQMYFPPCALIRADGMVLAIWRDPER